MPLYPEGRIKHGYRWRLRLVERVNGVRVIRTWLYATQSGSMVKRMSNYLSFAVTSVLLGYWGLGRQDVFLVDSPPLFLGPSGWLLARATGARFIFNVADVWPETAVALGVLKRDHLFVKAALWLEEMLYRHSDLVTGTSPGITANITSRFPGTPTAVVPNGVDTSKFRPDFRSAKVRQQFGLEEGQVAFVYAGLHGFAQGLDHVVEAARILEDRRDIRFVMIGDGPVREQVSEMARGYGLTNIVFYGIRPKSEMPAILASMDVALIPLGMELPGAMPSKSYEALACGLPLVVASRGDIAQFVARHGVGLAVEPGNAEALAGLVRQVADDPDLRRRLSLRSRQAAQEFDRDVVARRTSKLFEDLAGFSSGSKEL